MAKLIKDRVEESVEVEVRHELEKEKGGAELKSYFTYPNFNEAVMEYDPTSL